MPPLPKRKYSKARRGERRSHLGVTPANMMECPQCHSPKVAHHVCPTCGQYDGRDVIEIKSVTSKQKGK
jgi:large subunit ribosomal protein L32